MSHIERGYDTPYRAKPKMVKPHSKYPEKYPEEEIFQTNREHRQELQDLKLKGFPLRDWIFCHEVMRDGNVADAARRSGFSEAVAKQASSKWLPAKREKSEKPHVWDQVKELMRERIEKAEITANQVLKEWANIAFFDPLYVFDGSMNLKDLDQIPEAARKVISKVKTTTSRDGGTTREVQFHSKMEALNSLARYQNMFADDNKRQWEGTLTVDYAELPTAELHARFLGELAKLPDELRAKFTNLLPEVIDHPPQDEIEAEAEADEAEDLSMWEDGP